MSEIKSLESKYNPEFWQDQKKSTENEIIEKYETRVKATGLKTGLKNTLDSRLKQMALTISRVYQIKWKESSSRKPSNSDASKF